MSNASSSLRKSLQTLTALALTTTIVGCAIHHRVAFETAPYTTKATRQNAAIVAVIDEGTLKQTSPVRVSVNGYDNVWEVQPGDMLKQIADIELPQMFTDYAFATNQMAPPGAGGPGIVLSLSVPNYVFADSQATVTVKAVGRARNGKVLFDKTYVGQGPGQLARAVVFTPEAMEATIRDSSVSAYKEAFGLLREDLERALGSNPVVAR